VEVKLACNIRIIALFVVLRDSVFADTSVTSEVSKRRGDCSYNFVGLPSG
jgi:hypothetical protein